MQVSKLSTLALGLALFAGAQAHATETYTFEVPHSEIGFDISHWGLFTVHGNFDKFDGAIQYDDKDVTKSSVKVTIDAASIDTRNEMRDHHLRSGDFFDVANTPTASFTSTKIESDKDGNLQVTGDLSLHGVTKSVVLASKITGLLDDGMGKQRLGFIGKVTINRTDFGIAWNKTNKEGKSMLGETVDITVQGEAVKGNGMHKPADKPADAPAKN
jgi:polyisoprenoid-binding protein YceI